MLAKSSRHKHAARGIEPRKPSQDSTGRLPTAAQRPPPDASWWTLAKVSTSTRIRFPPRRFMNRCAPTRTADVSSAPVLQFFSRQFNANLDQLPRTPLASSEFRDLLRANPWWRLLASLHCPAAACVSQMLGFAHC